MMNGYITVDNIKIPIENEKNLLELIRKANIEIPTFCYHSKLSVYGACRLCLVDLKGKGLVTSCSTPPKDGMVIKTQTPEIRKTRRMIVELLLANHEMTCPTCERSETCKLRQLAHQLGIEKIRFKPTKEERPIDDFSDSLVRNPNKCIFCGDCVRYCSEIQGIGAIDFAYRGEDVMVTPAYGKSIGEVDCINCGQCAAVCPTAAIVPKSEIDNVWSDISDRDSYVVAQIAPAVRVALGEMFGIKSGESLTGKIVTALKMLGFDKVYDTSFGADLTVIEEATEFINRKEKNENLPIFTSCCPGWVKYAEQSHPELLNNLSTCMSPQSMLGSLIKHIKNEDTSTKNKKIKVVSIMPCTAKKFEKNRKELGQNGEQFVDHVLTTQEFGKMIKEAGIKFEQLPVNAVDLPFGFTTGAGVIFGNSGGVSEAVLRYAYEKITEENLPKLDFQQVRNSEGIKECSLNLKGKTIKLAVVHGIKNAEKIAKKVKNKEADYDMIEIMACPQGCIGGAGQPINQNSTQLPGRKKGLYDEDKKLQLQKSQLNPYIEKYYEKYLGKYPNSKTAHKLLHTHFQSRKRIQDDSIELVSGTKQEKIPVRVCVGTSCYLKGSQDILTSLIKKAEKDGTDDYLDIRATFCTENCDKGPTVTICEESLHHASFKEVIDNLDSKICKIKAQNGA